MASAFERRRLLTGAVLAACSGLGFGMRAHAQPVMPTPVPARIQTPDLAFVDTLQRALTSYSQAEAASELILSIVPAEPASDQLLNDARTGANRYAGAFVPNWLIADLVRDQFILPVSPPPAPLPRAIAQLRAFGGEWVATDLDHDCDLLYFRSDILGNAAHRSTYRVATGLPLDPPVTWAELEHQAGFFLETIGGGMALPQTHAQQVVDHFSAMAASYVIDGSSTSSYWFDPVTMEPAISSSAHAAALETWRRLAQTTPAPLRTGSTGDLWQAFLEGSVTYLIASADFLAFALEQGINPDVIGAAPLPGRATDAGDIISVGNAAGACWGGVIMAATGANEEVAGFLEHLATSTVQQELWSDPASGITPAPTSNSIAGNVETLVAAGWPRAAADSWIQAIDATLSNTLQLPSLRIAETRRYLQALEDRIVPFLATATATASETLALAAADWRQINEAIGVAVQGDLYARSMMSPPVVAAIETIP